MNDDIELAGSQAWHNGLGDEDCPYGYTYDTTKDYWQSEICKRQRWLHGMRRAGQQNEIMMRNRRWQRSEWTWREP